MVFNKFLSVGVFQGKIQTGNANANFEKTIEQLNLAETRGIDILCMPESFLHGYFETKEEAVVHSIDLDSEAYSVILEKLKQFNKTTLLLGLNERHNNQIYNTVVVIEKGIHVGKYRKAYTYSPYDYFNLAFWRHFLPYYTLGKIIAEHPLMQVFGRALGRRNQYK